MKRLLPILLALLFAATIALGRPGDAQGAQGGDTAAVAVNTRDDSSVFRLAFAIRRVGGDVVENSNAAVAYSSCERCRATAISIQIVLVTGDPSVVTPANVAMAVNYQCTLCQTFATAYQFVVSTGGPVRFTAEGLREIAAIRRELRALQHADLSPFELQRRVSALMQRLRHVLATQLRPAGPGDRGVGDDDEVTAGDDDLEPAEAPREGGAVEDDEGERLEPEDEVTTTTETTVPDETGTTATTTTAETTTTTP